jgi:hypothetical protein
MAGKLRSASVGEAVCGRAAVSPTQPAAAPATEKARLYCPLEMTRTEAMARIGEIAASRRSTSRSTVAGTR